MITQQPLAKTPSGATKPPKLADRSAATQPDILHTSDWLDGIRGMANERGQLVCWLLDEMVFYENSCQGAGISRYLDAHHTREDWRDLSIYRFLTHGCGLVGNHALFIYGFLVFDWIYIPSSICLSRAMEADTVTLWPSDSDLTTNTATTKPKSIPRIQPQPGTLSLHTYRQHLSQSDSPPTPSLDMSGTKKLKRKHGALNLNQTPTHPLSSSAASSPPPLSPSYSPSAVSQRSEREAEGLEWFMCMFSTDWERDER